MTKKPIKLAIAAVTVGVAFVLGYGSTPVMAQVGTPSHPEMETLDSSLPALAVLTAIDTGEPAGPTVPPTARDVLLDVCHARGYGEDCARTLYGMAWKESVMDSQAVGDRGKAQGYFQIHYKLHGISLRCAQDLKCSATWSLGYMERNGYPKYVSQAVQCHNGCGIRNGYAAAVKSVGNRKWREADLAELTEASDAKAEAKPQVTKVVTASAAVPAAPASHDGGQPVPQTRQLAAMTTRERDLMTVLVK